MTKGKFNFGILGVAGYIAPRHLKAIKETNGNLVAALDKSDSVGILDSYFPDCSFFTEFERFERYCEKHHMKKDQDKIDYVSICTPNYLHDAHIRFGLRIGADVICEKPLVLNPWNIESLLEVEKETGKKINTVLQLRNHPTIKKLKQEIDDSYKGNMCPLYKYDIELTYITPRGKWYQQSWKADLEKSGGVATNIGIHFFDMLTWIFGGVETNELYLNKSDKLSGYLELEKARVKWYLSLDKKDIPLSSTKNQYRQILINDKELEFSDGFTDLHTEVYRDILNGKGYGINDALPSIEIVSDIRKKQKQNNLDNILYEERKHKYLK